MVGRIHDLRYLTSQRRRSMIMVTKGNGRNSWRGSGFARGAEAPSLLLRWAANDVLESSGYVRKARCSRSIDPVDLMQSRAGLLRKPLRTGVRGCELLGSSMSRPLSLSLVLLPENSLLVSTNSADVSDERFSFFACPKRK
jgi:hypothetical protein